MPKEIDFQWRGPFDRMGNQFDDELSDSSHQPGLLLRCPRGAPEGHTGQVELGHCQWGEDLHQRFLPPRILRE